MITICIKQTADELFVGDARKEPFTFLQRCALLGRGTIEDTTEFFRYSVDYASLENLRSLVYYKATKEWWAYYSG